MLFRTLSVFCALAFATDASARQITYLCELEPKGASIIMPVIAFGVDTEKNTAVVYDALIAEVKSKPIPAKVSKDGDKTVYVWNVRYRNEWGQSARLTYRAAMFENNGRMTISGRPNGYIDWFSAKGKCRESNFKIPGVG